MNCQIVLVSGVNDGNEIDRTVWDLAQMHPYVQSISAVPAGITKYRRGLYPIKPFTREESKDVLARVHSLQEKLLDKIGTRLIYAADEFYINAGYSVPGAEEYEGYHQIENGVGLMRSFEDEFMEAMETVPPPGMHVINIITGVCAYEKIFSLANIADSRYNNVRITVFKVTNEFFGEHVTVAGLVTGGDITAQMSDKINGGITLIPDVMLREGTDVFLDDVTVSEVERRLETKIEIVKPTGFALWKKIIGR